MTRSSSSWGPVLPFSSRMPTTVKATPLNDTCLPTSSDVSEPTRSSATLTPSSATRACASYSASVKARPSVTAVLSMRRYAGVVPVNVRHRVRRAVVGRGHRGGADHGGHPQHVRGVLARGDRPGVGHGQLGGTAAGGVLAGRLRRPPPGPPAPPPPVRPAAAGHAEVDDDGQGVAAERADLVLDGPARAGADGDQDDHRGYADQDAERGQARTGLVGGDARARRSGRISRRFMPVPLPTVVAGHRAPPDARRTRSGRR